MPSQVFHYENISKELAAQQPGAGQLITLGAMYGGTKPDDYNQDALLLKKGKGLELYDRMLLDDTVDGTLSLMKAMVKAADWEIEPASDDEKDIEIKDALKENLEAISPSFRDTLDNQLDCLNYGFSLMEPVWDRDMMPGKWWLRSIKGKYPHYCIFVVDDVGDLDYFYFEAEPDKHYDVKDFLLTVFPYVKNGSYYGTSILQSVYREWFQIDVISKFEGLYLQGMGIPALKVLYDILMSDEEVETIKTVIRRFQDNMHLFIPSIRDKDTGDLKPRVDVSFMEATRKSGDEFQKALSSRRTQIKRKLLLPDKLGFTDEGSKSGSYNIGQIQFEGIVQSVIGGISDRQADVFNRQLFRRWVDYNYGPQYDAPKLKAQGLGKGVTEAKAKILGLLVKDAGVDADEEWVRPYLGVPLQDLKELAERKKEKKRILGDLAPPKQDEPPSPGTTPPGGGAPVPPGKAPEPPKPGQSRPASARDGVAPDAFSYETFQGEDRVDFQRIEETYEKEEARSVPMIEEVMRAIGLDLEQRIERKKIIERKDYRELTKLQYKKTLRVKLTRSIEETMGRMYFFGKLEANEEIKKAGKIIASSQMAEDEFLNRRWVKDWLEEHGMTLSPEDRKEIEKIFADGFEVARLQSEKILGQVKLTILNNIEIATARDIIAEVNQILGTSREQSARLIVRDNSAEYFNAGREEMFSEAGDLVESGGYSAILDTYTTEFCRKQNRRWLLRSDKMYPSTNAPNHHQCRSLRVPLFRGENYRRAWKPWLRSLKPAVGFGG